MIGKVYISSHSGLQLEDRRGVLGFTKAKGTEQTWMIHLGNGAPYNPLEPEELGDMATAVVCFHSHATHLINLDGYDEIKAYPDLSRDHCCKGRAHQL